MFLYVVQAASEGYSKAKEDVEQNADEGIEGVRDNIDIFGVVLKMSVACDYLYAFAGW